REKVAQIITYGTMAAKAVVRDVGRVLGFPYGFVDQLAKLIPFDPNMTLTRALADEAELQRRFDEDEEVKSILDLALSLEGIARNAGRHAGGLVIAPRPLTDYMPLYLEPNSEGAVTQFDMGDVEAIGLVKFDFLGLRTLTIIDWALAEINSARETPVEIGKIPLDDEATYELVRAQQTTAIFQLESRGMRELIKRLRPDCFGDLIALVALFRPGPLQSGMVDDFIERKHGRAQVKYPHPSLAPILLPTYGVILYQEQVMQIAQVLGGYTLGAADLLRRAMGKKKAEEMAEQREIFVSGAVNNAVDGELAAQIFDLMEKFAGYGFNKSHSAAYALIAYQTAWLKVHYPAAFMAAVLSSDMDSTEKVVRLIDECRALGIEVVSPDVNRCEFRFRVADDNTILYGLGAIKGVGESLISTLVEQREAEGSYDDLLSLCQRNYGKRLNRRALEALIRAGALDCFSLSRAQLTATLEQALTIAEQGHKSASAGQSDLFGDDSQAPCGIPQLAAAAGVREWTMDEVLEGEKNTLGHYLSGHPIDRYREELSQIVSASLAEVQCGRRRVAGIVDSVRSFKTRRGMNASVILDDNTARIELTLFRDVRDRYINRLVDGAIIVAEGNFEEDDYSGGYRLNVEQVYSIEEARNRYARAIVIDLNQEAFNPQTVPALKEIFSNYRNGHCSIEIEYSRSGGRARVKLGEQWQVEAADGLLNLLNDTVRGGRIHVEY
ncbi:MAG: DNA polymerase III subunit alpha, partial [Pseudomonadota bacterium]